MVELIHLIDDISTPVKLGWCAVVVWGAVQFAWFRCGRALPEELDQETASEGWSVARVLALFKRQGDDEEGTIPARSGLLSIAPAMDLPAHGAPEAEADLGEAAGLALEDLLDDPGDRHDRSGAPRRHLRSVPRPASSFSLESTETT